MFLQRIQILKEFVFLFGGDGGGEAGGGGGLLTKLESKIFFWGGRVWGGVDGWTDEQAQTNLPLQLLRSLGHNNVLMCKLCPWQDQFMTILSFDLQV